jgi:hypothetical protein
MRLKKAQKLKVVEWIAEGLTSDEINLRASDYDDPFEVSRSQVAYYREKHSIDIEKLRETAEFEALNEGLAKSSERVSLLKRIADRLVGDLFDDDLFWTDEVKGVGSGNIAQIVDYEEFNASEIRELRGVLDDIAKEVGGRVQKVDAKVETNNTNEVDDDKFDRAISSLADAVREGISGKSSESDGSMGSTE